jgi:hypothetical protein
MAIAERMLTNAERSPLYNSAEPGALRRLVLARTEARDPTPDAGVDLAIAARYYSRAMPSSETRTNEERCSCKSTIRARASDRRRHDRAPRLGSSIRSLEAAISRTSAPRRWWRRSAGCSGAADSMWSRRGGLGQGRERVAETVGLVERRVVEISRADGASG